MPAAPPTCRINRWLLFGPGNHKNELYSVARCQRIATNFSRMATAGFRVPVRIGHDKVGRFGLSLGLPSVGRVTACRDEGGGYLSFDISDVPTEVGEQVAAGRLPAASIELSDDVRDPDAANKTVPGDVLVGLALLGEERAAVYGFPAALRRLADPKPVFADGRPVPPAASSAKWLDKMADVLAGEPASYSVAFSDGSKCKARSVRFATPTPWPFPKSLIPPPPRSLAMPMTMPKDKPLVGEDELPVGDEGQTEGDHEDQLKALGLTPEQVAGVLKIFGVTSEMSEMENEGAAGGDAKPAAAFSTRYGRAGLTPLQLAMMNSESARRYAPRVRERLLGKR